LNPYQGKDVGRRRKRRWFTPHLNEKKIFPTPSLPFSYSSQQAKKSYLVSSRKEKQRSSSGLTFPHVVLLLWVGEDLTNFSLGERTGRVGRRCMTEPKKIDETCTTRNLPITKRSGYIPPLLKRIHHQIQPLLW
jgi:hypothetical protein